MCSTDDINRPVLSLMLSFHGLRGLPLRYLPPLFLVIFNSLTSKQKEMQKPIRSWILVKMQKKFWLCARYKLQLYYITLHLKPPVKNHVLLNTIFTCLFIFAIAFVTPFIAWAIASVDLSAVNFSETAWMLARINMNFLT